MAAGAGACVVADPRAVDRPAGNCVRERELVARDGDDLLERPAEAAAIRAGHPRRCRDAEPIRRSVAGVGLPVIRRLPEAQERALDLQAEYPVCYRYEFLTIPQEPIARAV